MNVGHAVASMAQAPDVDAPYRAWAASRQQFNAELNIPNSAARKQKWQKDYFQAGPRAPEDYHTKIKPRDFVQA